MQQYKAGKFDPQNPSMYLRWTFHKYAKEIIAEKPIIGHGTGSYPVSMLVFQRVIIILLVTLSHIAIIYGLARNWAILG